MLWLYFIVIANIIDPLEGRIVVNEDLNGEGLLDPGTVNAESDIVLDSLYRDDGSGNDYTFQIGDCFEI